MPHIVKSLSGLLYGDRSFTGFVDGDQKAYVVPRDLQDIFQQSTKNPDGFIAAEQFDAIKISPDNDLVQELSEVDDSICVSEIYFVRSINGKASSLSENAFSRKRACTP